MATINKQLLEHLLGLAHLEVDEKEKEALIEDMRAILGYVEQLEEVDTDAVEPMAGGTLLRTEVREDGVDIDAKKKAIGEPGRIIEEFPEEKDGYLKIPPVF